jgi:hypothetical protein
MVKRNSSANCDMGEPHASERPDRSMGVRRNAPNDPASLADLRNIVANADTGSVGRSVSEAGSEASGGGWTAANHGR